MRTARQSGAGTTSSSISQMRSQPPAYAVSMPIRKPPAPPTFSSLRITWSGRSSRAEHLLRVVAARVVHHDHGGDRVRLDDQGVEHPGEQVGPVVGDDDDGDGLGGLSHAGTSGGR